MTQRHADSSDQSLMMNDGERIPRAVPAGTAVSSAAHAAICDDDLIDDGLCLFHRDEPDPDLAWKAGLYDQYLLETVRHERVMTDAAEVLLELLRRCSKPLEGYDYCKVMKTHIDLVYPRAVFENETDNILRDIRARNLTDARVQP